MTADLSRLANVPVSPAHLAVRATRGSASPWIPAKWHLYLNRLLVDIAYSPVSRFVIVSCPPRHGKSLLTSRWFPAWYLGMFPEKRVIVTSYETDFVQFNSGRPTREILQEFGEEIFGVRVSQTSSAAGRWDLAGHNGGLTAVGMGGSLTGRGMDLGLLDDPVKGWEEAQSENYRLKQWEWYQATFRTRLQPGGSICLIMTRWNEEDLAGMVLRSMRDDPLADRWEVVRFPALAEPDDDVEAQPGFDPVLWTDQLGRHMGEALWPERMPVSYFDQFRSNSVVWESLYQQRPSPKEGTLFRTDRWGFVGFLPADVKVLYRRWDLAATEKRQGSNPDWTAGVLLGRDSKGLTYVVDVVRARIGPEDVEALLRQTAVEDYMRYQAGGEREVRVRVSQDPGQAAKAQVGYLRRFVFPEFNFDASVESGDKVTRAQPFAMQHRAGFVRIVTNEDGSWPAWVKPYINEFRVFPGPKDDQVDATALAYSEAARLDRTRARLVV